MIKSYLSFFGAAVYGLTLLTGCYAMAAQPQLTGLPVQLGPRPFYLVDQMTPGPLKDQLAECALQRDIYRSSTFSIGHRGAPLQFPEHTRESYLAAARMGAGVLECDVNFTQDRQLVCRHSQCDLHKTTNIVATELAEKCQVPPVLGADNTLENAGDIRCCTSDITLEEFDTLHGKMDWSDSSATTVEGYMNGVADHRTNLYSGASRGTLMSHVRSIELFKALGVGMTPELKTPLVPMPFQGDYSREDYARQMIDEYIAAGVPPSHVRPQSFSLRDITYWLDHRPEFGARAVLLDRRPLVDSNNPQEVAALEPSMTELFTMGVTTLAPPIQVLLATESGVIVPSAYARHASNAGLELITWTMERSGKLEPGTGGSSYATVADVIKNDGDIFTVIDALADGVGVSGIFSDWPATTTFYANCMETGVSPLIPRQRSFQSPHDRR